MMFGFLKGKIEIKLDRYSFGVGDTIEGDIMLNLKKPLQARELSIGIFAEEKRTDNFGGKRRTVIRRIYDFKQPVSGEQEYTTTSMHHFKINAPASIPDTEAPLGEAAGNLLKAAKFLFGARSSIKWFIIARLDVKGFDVTKKVQISIS